MRRLTVLLTVAITFAILGLTAAPASRSLAPGRQGVAANLIGGWSLESRVTTTGDGKSMADPALSAAPKGILIYDAYGHVAAQLSRPGRTVDMLEEECGKALTIKGTNDTAQTVLGYDAYFGTYTVDEARGIVTHHLESALFPGDIGKSIIRHFVISGDVLTISFPTTLADGTAVIRTLVWKRLK